MKFPPYFLRLVTPSLANLLLIIAVGSLSLVRATSLQAESDAERYVLEQVQKGGVADLESKFPRSRFPEETRKLRGSFIAALLTYRDAHWKIPTHNISISHATISGGLNLIGEEIPYDVSMDVCTFDAFVNLSGSHFAKSFNVFSCTFDQGIYFSLATIDYDLVVAGCNFAPPEFDVSFAGMRVGRDFKLVMSRFERRPLAFERVRIGGTFEVAACWFKGDVFFNEMRIDGSFSIRLCQFGNISESAVSFAGSHFGDLYLNTDFQGVSAIDLSRVQTDLISFDDIAFGPNEMKLEQMTFKRLSPVDADKLQFLLSRYSADFYTNLETWFRTHGYPDEADNFFIAKKRAERRENCKDFFRQCERGSWAFSIFQDGLAGYGKSLQNLLGWSLGFLLIGTIVFRSEKGMRTKDRKDGPYYAGRYHPFWYSLDLFLPIIKLGEAETWTPKDNRRWAIFYKKVHIIIGSLFVPIGLAAWTGIIK